MVGTRLIGVQRPAWCVLGVLVVVAVGGCGDEPAEPAAGSDVWTAAAQAPLSPRENAVVVAVDGRFLVVGGSDAPPCPPGGECTLPEQPPLSDGAIFDPATDRWSRIADAPVPLGGYADTSYVVVAGMAYILSHQLVPGDEIARTSFVSYDSGADTWTVLPNPPAEDTYWLRLTAASDYLITYPTSHEGINSPGIQTAEPLRSDLLFRPVDQTWHVLPADPHGPSFDRTMLTVDDRVILLCQDLVENPGVDPPLVRMAALDIAGDPLSATWTVLPDGEFLWPTGYVSVGGLLVSPHVGSADGGETNNWGHEYPYGGIVDPKTGEWSPFPSVPEHDPKAWGIGPSSITGERTVIDGSWAIDVKTLNWTPVPQRAQDAGGNEAPLPTTGHVSALVDTPDGPVTLVWGGTRWAEPDSPTSDYELLDDGWLWRVPTPA